jgi:hypothetical protein
MRAVPAGVADAAAASLAAFATSLYAVRSLDVAALGDYALFFSAYVLAAVVPAQLVFGPANIIATAWSQPVRARLLSQLVRLGGPVAALSSAVAVTAACLLAADSDRGGAVLPLALTAAVCACVSPLQDQVRAVLHLAGRSWAAARVSTIHASVVFVALGAMSTLQVSAAWVPLGALALGNIVSSTVALLISRAAPGAAAQRMPRFTVGQLSADGRWLLVIEAGAAGSFFLASAMVTLLAGPVALGHAEAARVVAHPLFVLTVGLSAVLGPRSMEAGRSLDALRADRIARAFAAILVAAAGAWTAVLLLPATGDVMSRLLPAGLAVPGLVPLTVLASLAVGLAYPARAELLGAGQVRRLVLPAMLASLACVAVSSVAALGAYARPCGWLAFGCVLARGYWHRRRALFRPRPPAVAVELAWPP